VVQDFPRIPELTVSGPRRKKPHFTYHIGHTSHFLANAKTEIIFVAVWGLRKASHHLFKSRKILPFSGAAYSEIYVVNKRGFEAVSSLSKTGRYVPSSVFPWTPTVQHDASCPGYTLRVARTGWFDWQCVSGMEGFCRVICMSTPSPRLHASCPCFRLG
jgi:hypothetical protein